LIETVTYYLALVTLVTVPATLVAWLLLHPLAPTWRRMGTVGAFALISAVVMAVMLGMYYVREPLLSVRFDVKMPLVVVSGILFGISSFINALVYRQAPHSMVFGLAELSEGNPGRLVTGGIYARVRHPRFVAMFLAVLSIAMFTNVLAVYVIAVIYIPVILLVALLEDRELAARFGPLYDEYAKEVPRFLPRPAKQGTHGKSAT